MPENLEKLPQGIYRHFKGNNYDVLGVAVHSETGEQLVVYRPMYGDRKLTVRPLEMFTDHVERGKYSGPRFVLVMSNESGLKEE